MNKITKAWLVSVALPVSLYAVSFIFVALANVPPFQQVASSSSAITSPSASAACGQTGNCNIALTEGIGLGFRITAPNFFMSVAAPILDRAADLFSIPGASFSLAVLLSSEEVSSRIKKVGYPILERFRL